MRAGRDRITRGPRSPERFRCIRAALHAFGAVLIAVCTHAALEFFGHLRVVDDSAYETHAHESVLPAVLQGCLLLLAIVTRAAFASLATRDDRALARFARRKPAERPLAVIAGQGCAGLAVLYGMETIEHLRAFGHPPDLAEVLGGSVLEGLALLLCASLGAYLARATFLRLCLGVAARAASVLGSWMLRASGGCARTLGAYRRARRSPRDFQARLRALARVVGRRGPPPASFAAIFSETPKKGRASRARDRRSIRVVA